MHIVITGGAGFIGARLARTLLAQGRLSLAGAAAQPITALTLLDLVGPPTDIASDARVNAVVGVLQQQLSSTTGEPAAHGPGLPPDTAVVFHLAAAVSGECEADFDLGLASNLQATQQLLEACRALGTKPLVVFASSLAVFGGSPTLPLPAVIQDHTLPTPQSSYGIQKFIGEQLVADYSRKGFIDGRSVRLMTVSVRPGRPNGAASSFLSGMIREPLAGLPGRCPVEPQTAVALSSPARAIEGLLRAAEAGASEWGAPIAVNLPSLAVTVGEMAAALERAGGAEAAALLDWTRDPLIERLVTGWPARVDFARARALGLAADADFDAVVRSYIDENPDAVKLHRVNG
ncbi:MAG: D-erythronate dehydrogenase [Variovorax sp.]